MSAVLCCVLFFSVVFSTERVLSFGLFVSSMQFIVSVLGLSVSVPFLSMLMFQ